MRNPKLLFALVVAALAAIVIFQNREPLDMQLLFFKVTMSRAAALGLSFLAGVLVGFLAFSRWSARKSGKGMESAG